MARVMAVWQILAQNMFWTVTLAAAWLIFSSGNWIIYHIKITQLFKYPFMTRVLFKDYFLASRRFGQIVKNYSWTVFFVGTIIYVLTPTVKRGR